jgi:thiosulfate reductase cytochrome b subunit
MEMAVAEQGMSMVGPPRAGGRNTAAVLSMLGGLAGLVILILMFAWPDGLKAAGAAATSDPVALSLYGAAVLFMIGGALLTLPRMGLGGAIALTGTLFWLAGCIVFKSMSWVLAAPLALSFLGALTGLIGNDRHISSSDGNLIYRQFTITRITHWVWAVAMFFLLLSGLQIFNARPNLYIGQQSGFTEQTQNSILDIYVANRDGKPVGQTKLFGQVFETTGLLGVSGPEARPSFTAFPGSVTIPSYRDLGTGRVVHFFFAWILVGTLAVWLINAIFTGHLWRDIILKPRDISGLPADIVAHIKLKFEHGKSYSPLQKVAYFAVFAILFPLIILTGLTMSPTMDAAWPWLLELFGGRQTARTIHFLTMLALVLFFIVHIIMVVLANPINEVRSMITGYYRSNVHVKPEANAEKSDA